MKNNVCDLIRDLLAYAEREQLADPADRTFLCNRLMEELGVNDFTPTSPDPCERPLE